jgi:prepilin-type N-terminal cleavage/methylation domain-containing protein
MIQKKDHQVRKNQRGVSIIEILIVLTITAILTAIAVPQLMSQRRLMRSSAVVREFMTQLRYARQLAMSQQEATATGPFRRVAYTFQYNDALKQIRIIGPIPAGTASLVDPTYPSLAGSRVVTTVSLLQGGLPSSEISYGFPTTSELPTGSPAFPQGALGDGVSRTDLTNNIVNITFQPDGSVVDATNNPLDRALFIYNNKAPLGTASAVSVLGASGRVKMWRYRHNVNLYAE